MEINQKNVVGENMEQMSNDLSGLNDGRGE